MRSFLLVAMALAACETPQPPPCPGSRIASFDFTAADAGASDSGQPCSFDGGLPSNPAFTAVLAWDPSGTAAAICKQRPYAQPAIGTHLGNHVTVQSSSEGTTIAGCGSSCAVTILEVVDGDVTPDEAAPTRFSGTLRNDLTGASPDGGTPSCSCVLPCSVTWTLQGTP